MYFSRQFNNDINVMKDKPFISVFDKKFYFRTNVLSVLKNLGHLKLF